MVRAYEMIRRIWNPFSQRVSGASKDHKEEIMEILMRAVRWWNLPSGDYLEFGVYQGRSFIHAYQSAREYHLDMHFYAFDSFQGLPEIRGQDRACSNLRKGDYACDEESFRRILIRNNVDLNDVTIIPGFFDKTLNERTRDKLRIHRAAIVWIDCDIYESTKSVLDFITPYLTTGSIIAFDDWFLFGADPRAGEMGATREWLKKETHVRLVEYKQFGLFGQSFIVQIEEVPLASR